jgi:hypothetical protein
MKIYTKMIIFRCFVLIPALVILLMTSLCITRQSDDWMDDGVRYLCPQCQLAVTFPCVGNCTLCGEEIGTISYKYCYDCSKYLGCCQMCGVER